MQAGCKASIAALVLVCKADPFVCMPLGRIGHSGTSAHHALAFPQALWHSSLYPQLNSSALTEIIWTFRPCLFFFFCANPSCCTFPDTYCNFYLMIHKDVLCAVYDFNIQDSNFKKTLWLFSIFIIHSHNFIYTSKKWTKKCIPQGKRTSARLLFCF